MFAHACVAPSESLCVCLAKQCCTALIRPGKWLLFSLTARAVYRAFENYILWRGSDLTWRVKSTAKNRSTSFRQINATAPDVRTDWITNIRVSKLINRWIGQDVLHRTLKGLKWHYRMIIHANLQQERQDFRDHRCRKLQESCLQVFLTLDTVRGMLKSLPPCSLKPQGAGPLRVIEYMFIALGKKREKTVS